MYICEVDLVLERENITDLDGLKSALLWYDESLVANERANDVEWYARLEEEYECEEASMDGAAYLAYYSPREVRDDIRSIIADYVVDMAEADLVVCAEEYEMEDVFERYGDD